MQSQSIISGFKSRKHNHRRCIDQALRTAADICAVRGGRFTPIRRLVLKLIWSEHKPVPAYDLLERLNSEGHKALPPTVYRALEFLSAMGLIHRIESLNAYVGCADPRTVHSGQFLICEHCHGTAELDDTQLDHLIANKATATGFRVARQTVEVYGACPACQA